MSIEQKASINDREIKYITLYFSDNCKIRDYNDIMEDILYEWIKVLFFELINIHPKLNYEIKQNTLCSYTRDEINILYQKILTNTQKIINLKLDEHHRKVDTKMLQCMGSAAFYIAWGISIDENIRLDDLVFYADDSFTLDILNKIVLDMLDTIKHNGMLLY